jgi:hypothetical protein
MGHLQDRHDMDVRVSEVACPLCEEFSSGDYHVLSLHIARHMEEIALAILPSGVDSEEESADDSSNHSDSSNGHEKDSYAPLDEISPWMQFKYSRDGVVTEYTLRIDVGSVDVERLPHGFKIENCIYPRALVPRDQYEGSDLNKEKECNFVGWALAELNPSLQGHRGVLQEAVESICDVSKTGKKHIRYNDSGQVLENSSNIRNPTPRLTARDWNLHKELIAWLYVKEHRTLSQVRQILECTYGFVATYVDYIIGLPETNNSVRHSQYRTMFAKWGLQKYKKGKMKTVAAEIPASSLSEKLDFALPIASSGVLWKDITGLITEAESHPTLQPSELQDAPKWKIQDAPKSKERTSRLTPRGCPGKNWTCKPTNLERGRWTSWNHFREHYTTHHLEEHRPENLHRGRITCHLCGSAVVFQGDGDALTRHIFDRHL